MLHPIIVIHIHHATARQPIWLEINLAIRSIAFQKNYGAQRHVDMKNL